MLSLLLSIFFSSANALTLKEALTKVANHPVQRAQNLETQRASIYLDKSWLNIAPSISSSWQKSSTSNLDSFGSPTWSISAGINLFSGLSDFYTISARSSALSATVNEEEWTLIKNEQTVAEIFFQCLFAQKSEQAYQEAYQIGLQISDIEKNRYNKGLKSRDDYLKLKVDAENNNIRYISEQNRKETCLTQLRFWVGEFKELSPIDLGFVEPNVEQFNQNTHPNLLSSKKSLDVYKAIAKASVGAHIPRLDLSYKRSYLENPENYSNLIYLTATWNIFDSGQTLSQTRLSFIDAEKAEETYNEKLRSITRDLQSQATNLRDRNRQSKIADENLRDVKLTFKTSLSRFRAGAISANEVALDQSRLISATISYYDLLLQRNISVIKYQSSLGKRISDLLGDKK